MVLPGIDAAGEHDALASGDIYLGKGDTDQAIEQYRLALDNLEECVGNRELLIIKLEALGATAEGAAEPQAASGGGEV